MRQKQRVFSLFLLSPSSRRAWIEIRMASALALEGRPSPSSRRAWIEIHFGKTVVLFMFGRPPRGGRG